MANRLCRICQVIEVHLQAQSPPYQGEFRGIFPNSGDRKPFYHNAQVALFRERMDNSCLSVGDMEVRGDDVQWPQLGEIAIAMAKR